MKIRTAEMLCDKVSHELSWRKKELTELRHAIEKSSLRVGGGHALSRCGVTLVYAHWEGFVKIAGVYLLEHLNAQRLKNCEITDNFLTMIIKDGIEKRGQSYKASSLSWITDYLLNKISERCVIPYQKSISTKGNLTSEVLKEIIWCLGLDYSPFEPHEKFLDTKLLAVRNKVAHGEWASVDVDDYLELHEKIIDLMNMYRNQIENVAVNKSFCKPVH